MSSLILILGFENIFERLQNVEQSLNAYTHGVSLRLKEFKIFLYISLNKLNIV